MFEYLLLLGDLARALTRTRADLVTENLPLRQELAVMTRPTRKRPPLRGPDRVFWLRRNHNPTLYDQTVHDGVGRVAFSDGEDYGPD
jgi:hypothetical protein